MLIYKVKKKIIKLCPPYNIFYFYSKLIICFIFCQKLTISVYIIKSVVQSYISCYLLNTYLNKSNTNFLAFFSFTFFNDYIYNYIKYNE